MYTAFRVIEPISDLYFEEGFGEEESNDEKAPEKALEKALEKAPEKVKETIFNLLKKNPSFSAKEIATKIQKTITTVKYHLRKMTDEGVIKHEGATKSGKWVILKELKKK